MNKPKVNKTFAIRHKETGEYFVSGGGKNAWRSIGAAKNAFAYHGASLYLSDEDVKLKCREYKVEPVVIDSPCRNIRLPYFDEQDVWEIVELSAKVEDCGKRLKEAERLLHEIWNYGYNGEDQIKLEKFLFGERSE